MTFTLRRFPYKQRTTRTPSPVGIEEDAEPLEIIYAAKYRASGHSVFCQPNGQPITVQLLRRHQVAHSKVNVHLPISVGDN